MFSQFVTAAKGLFAKKDSVEESPRDADYTSDPAAAPERPNSATSETSKMVTATRNGRIRPREKESSPEVNGSGVGNGKRKAESASSAKTNGQSGKRRKRTSEDEQMNSDGNTNSTSEATVTPAEKPKHFRFGSEEPVPAVDEPVEEVQETQQNSAQSAEESDDDEAPEAIDNSAQLLRMKEQAQKQERARQKAELLKKEKRRQLDELHKSQAKTANKKRKTEYQDDVLSESTATLQGSVTQDTRRPALPALLPDEILNAAPDVRPPTPPPEEAMSQPQKPNKLRFLEKVEKAPKDLKRGSTTVRVLDGKKSTPALAPKVSKAGRNLRESWLTGKRANVAQVNGLRRTTGGTSGFVRSR